LGQATLPAFAAHEINNAAESLLGLLYLLKTGAALTEKERHYLTLAQEEVRRISKIAQEAMCLHELVVLPERTNVGELLAAVLDLLKSKLDSSGIVVQTRFSYGGRVSIYVDQLRQVFSNLLLNAVDAMPEGGAIQARVSEGHEWSGQGRHGIRVTIADNGLGMPPDVLSRIFQRGFTTKSAGHGIGLSVVTGTVQKHRGVLHVRSSTQAIRHGTVFALFLPVG
jgi:signal transduction histidine kinase